MSQVIKKNTLKEPMFMAETSKPQSLGGLARAKKLSPERRKEIASLAAKKRWNKGEEIMENTEEIDLKKIGLKFARNSEKLDHLCKVGLTKIEWDNIAKEFTLKMCIRFKDKVTFASYSAPTLCEVVEQAYEVHQ